MELYISITLIIINNNKIQYKDTAMYQQTNRIPTNLVNILTN